MRTMLALVVLSTLMLSSCKKEDKNVEYQVDCAHCVVTWANRNNEQFTEVTKGYWRQNLWAHHDWTPRIEVRPAPGVPAVVHVVINDRVWKSSGVATYGHPYTCP